MMPIQTITKYIQILLNIGVRTNYPFSLQHQVRTINRISLVNLLMLIIMFAGIGYFLSNKHIEILYFGAISYTFPLLCNHFSYHRLAKYVHLFANLFISFLFCGVYGHQNSIYIVLLMTGMITTFLNGFEHKKETLGIALLTLFFLMILYALDFSFYKEEILPYPFLRNLLRMIYIGMFTEIIVTSYIKITDARVEEEKLRESEGQLAQRYAELHKNHQDLDQFVYRVSHDLRAPLVSALGLVDICSKEGEDTFNFYLTLQETSLKKLDILIHDILQYSRNSRMELQIGEVSFEQLLAEVFDFNAYKDPYGKIQRKVNITQNIPFYSDNFRLKIILNNLIANALQYQDALKPRSFVEIKVEVNEKEAKIIIQDNGLGVDEAHLPNIFDMFYRANIKSVGSGLGLYIIREVLDKLNGEIEVQSTLGEMTVCTLHLPNLVPEKVLYAVKEKLEM
ncbi:MAG: sensor histidine kinase, partial [Bacteroidia bacterium]